MRGRYVKLGELCTQIRGVSYKKNQSSNTRKEGYLPILRANNISSDGKINLNDLVYIPEDIVNTKQRLVKNDILIATSSGSIQVVGKAARIDKNLSASFGAFCKVLRPEIKKINPLYLSMFFKSEIYKRQILKHAQGANINNLRNEHFDNLGIYYPSLKEQADIARILDKAQSLIDKRKQAIAKLDELVRSVFYTFFSNRNLFNEFQLKECIEIPLNAGWSPVCSENNNGIPVFSLANLREDGLSTKITKFYDGDLPPKGADLKEGDILISRSNTRDLVGRVGLYEGFPSPVIYPDLMIRIRVKQDRLNPIYFLYYLISISRVIRNLAHGSNESMVKISQSKLLSLPVIIPPKYLQDEFAEYVQQIKAQKQKMQQQLEQLEQNFNSLLHRAFTGQLTMNEPIAIEN